MNSCNDIGRCRQGSNDSARCCTHDCRQGRDCPARADRVTHQTATPLNTDNSDGSSAGNSIDELLDDTGRMLLRGIALLVLIVSLIVYASL